MDPRTCFCEPRRSGWAINCTASSPGLSCWGVLAAFKLPAIAGVFSVELVQQLLVCLLRISEKVRCNFPAGPQWDKEWGTNLPRVRRGFVVVLLRCANWRTIRGTKLDLQGPDR